MATKLYEEDITKHIDWGGDEVTHGLPVAGEKIQKFIKKSLESKFGYMYYDKISEGRDESSGITVANHTASNQYLVFADKENCELWAANPAEGGRFILGRFDAPAPATIEVSNTGAYSKTILLSDKDNQEISFNYVVKDKSNTPQAGQSTISISINNNISGTRTLPTIYVDIPSDAAAGVNFPYDEGVNLDFKFSEISKYLNEGVNTINFTITSLMHNVSTTITYQYRILDLDLSSTFGNSQSEYNMYKCINIGDNSFTTSITASGAGDKMLRVFIDGKQINVIDSRTNAQTLDLFIGTNSPSQYDVVIPFTNAQGETYEWVTEGKHNIQMYFYINNAGADNIIKSQTLYYDFVLVEENSNNYNSYILLQRKYENNTFANIVKEGQDPSIAPNGYIAPIKAEQYIGFEFDYIVLDTLGRVNSDDGSGIKVNINIFSKDDITEPESSEWAVIPSGTGTTYYHTSQDYGDKVLQIINTLDENNGKIDIDLNIKQSTANIEKTTQGLVLELSALNRSNDELPETRSTWKYERMVGTKLVTYEAEFNKVLWNSQNGWDNKNNCLVLNNGATVTIPVNIFSFYNAGVTFEIDFETENVQDDEALIMQYGNTDGASISIKACEASLQSNGGVNIHTNYKDGARQKIAFIFGDNNANTDDAIGDCPYLMYIVVNGILDRVAQFTKNDNCTGTSEDYAQFIIGNTNGKVTTKIHTIRIYSTALTLDNCVNNFIIDSNDVRGNYLRNDIYNTDGKTININKILSSDLHIPVMTIYGDITNSIVQVFDKKANVPVDILYQDPMHPEFNYFARDAWMSNQGTSSMNYPRRNFRPYFNKKADSKTLRGFATNDRYKYETRVWWGLTDTTTIARIQQGLIDPDEPFTINDIEYKPLRNKKTLKKPQTIDYDTAIMFVHSGIKIYKDVACTKKIKNLNEYINEYEAEHQNQNAPIYVLGAYARYKTKDLFTDRWTLKCDYAESSMTHNAGVGRLWGDVMRDVEIGTEGFTYDIDGEKIMTSKPGMTNAQRAVQEYNEAHADKTIKINGTTQQLTFGDIRTSCDGYPIIIINRPRIKNGTQYTEDYGNPVFLGLYNIMTDKGSTPLFGFEDLKDEDGNTIFNAGNADQRTECWECLQNGSRLAQMNDATTDNVDGSTVDYTSQFDADGEYISGGSDNKNRPIFKTYEARWPDNDDLNETRTDHLETVIRFVNFCKDAVSVRVGEPGKDKDGYELSDFTQIDDLTAQKWFEDKSILNSLPNKTLYLSVPGMSPKNKTDNFYATDENGKVIYDKNTGKPVLMDMEDAKANLYKKDKLLIYYRQTYASQVTATSTGSMEALYGEDETNKDLMIQRIYEILNSSTPYVYILEESDDPNDISYEPMDYYPNATDEIRQWYYIDKTFDRTIITKTINTATLKDDVYTGLVYTYDGKRLNNEGEQLHPDAWVTVYLTKNGNNYTYVDEMGKTVPYASGEEVTIVTGSGEKVSKETSFKGKTKFEYFQDQKYEHFDVWKLACYYVYLMRFAAVDQVIKNTMMTTEDGKHYYFINYDNDTTLGVRNDGYLAYDWQINRETYDESIGSYAYAGFGSVLWNTLEKDQDFLDKVKTAATAMVNSNVLTYDIALDMFNNKQSGTWCERLYNQSEMYKYIGTYSDIDNGGANPYQNTKYLPFLQGSRASHRDWWLRHRFDLYDSMWSAGEYATNRLDFYMGLEASPSNKQPFLRIVAGSKFYYTIIANNKVLGNNFVELDANEEYTFITEDTLILGNPMQMYGVYKAKVLDFSANRNGLGQVLTCSWVPEKGSLIEELILGGDKPTSEIPGCAVQGISQIDRLKTLKVLDIRTCALLKSIDISQLSNLTKFLADGSSINSFIPARGVMLEKVSLPSSITTLKLNDVSIDEFIFTPERVLSRVEIENVKGEAFTGHKLFDFILNWYITLKKGNARISDYSCNLSFERIELEEYYGNLDGELAENVNDWIASLKTDNHKKIKSLDLLNGIKNDFGLNNVGEENFKISNGVIKLYGDNENGGLTQENYEEMTNTKFNNTTISLWDDKWFRSDNSYHFDSNSSIFLTVTPYEHDKQPIYDDSTGEATYRVIAGKKYKITATIFPIENTRIIDIIPFTINDYGQSIMWTLSDGTYRNTFGQIGISSLKNNNGTAILDIYEYTDQSNKNMAISISDSLDSNNNSIININVENVTKPKLSEIMFVGENGDIPYPWDIIQQIDEVREYRYTLQFTKEFNVDISGVDVSFNSNTVINDNEFGSASVEFNDVENSYIVKYTPNIQNDDTSVELYVFIHLADRLNTVLTGNININLVTKKINDIQLTNNIETLTGEELTIEKYVKNTSEIQTSGSKKFVSYNYRIKIDPIDYNVPIKSMVIDIPQGYLVKYNIIPHNSADNDKIIESIDIELPVGKQSMYQIGEFNIIITDIYNNVTNKKVNVKLGYFLPDGINLVKTINNSDFDISNNSENTTLLSQSSPSIRYELHTYSKINNIQYVWGNSANITEKYYSDNSIKFLASNQYPNATYSELSNNSFSAITGKQDLRSGYYTINGFNINDSNTFTFTINTNNENTIFEALTNLKYTVSFNSVEAKLDKDICVERTSAIVTDFNYEAQEIHALGETNGSNEPYTADQCLYYLDKNLNLYNMAGYQQKAGDLGIHGESIENNFIALVLIYIDANGSRNYTTLDPWILASKELFIWWSANGTWYNDTLYGLDFNDQVGYHNLLGHQDGAGVNYWENMREGYLYSKWYDYYRIVCSQVNDRANNGGIFTLQSVGSYDMTDKDIPQLCTAYYNGDIEFANINNNSSVTNDNMIFYYINKYKNMGIPNMVCKPISIKDYENIMNNYDTFVTFLNELDTDNQYDFEHKLFDKLTFNFDSSIGETFDDLTTINSYTQFDHSKMYWYYESPDEETIHFHDYGIRNKENLQIGWDLNGSNPDTWEFRPNIENSGNLGTGSIRKGPDFLTYCLFGPSLT